jgi:hypothetical protein
MRGGEDGHLFDEAIKFDLTLYCFIGINQGRILLLQNDQ